MLPGVPEGHAMAIEIDPVCGMQVTESESAERSDYQDRTYYFCSRDCRVAFEKNTEPYAVPVNEPS